MKTVSLIVLIKIIDQLYRFVFLLSEQHFSDVVRGEEFYNLSCSQVCELINSDQLSVSSEEMVNKT